MFLTLNKFIRKLWKHQEPDDATLTLIKSVCKEYGVKLTLLPLNYADLRIINILSNGMLNSSEYIDNRSHKTKHFIRNLAAVVTYKHRSRKEIYLGVFNSNEKKLSAVFHELGHVVNGRKKYNSLYDEELDAWRVGLEISLKYNIKFSRKTIRCCNKCLESYDKERLHPRNRIRNS